jgi:hypothetical protein
MAEEIPDEVKRQIANEKTLQRVFGTPDGKQALYYLMHKGMMLDTGHSDARGYIDYCNGRRSLVIELLKDLRYDYARLYDLSIAANEPEAYNINP